MIRVLCVGDIHLKYNDITMGNKFIESIISKCEFIKPDITVILGDTLHTHETVKVDVYNQVYNLFSRISEICKLVVLIGNYDMKNQTLFLSESHFFNVFKRYKNIYIIDRPRVYTIHDIDFIFCPYVSNGRFVEMLNTINEGKYDWKTIPTTIFAHQEFMGCKMNYIYSDTGDIWNLEWPTIISGHIHESQIINNIYYPGTPRQCNFGDTTKKYVWILSYSESKEMNINKISLHLTRRKNIIVSTEYIKENIIEIQRLSAKYILQITILDTMNKIKLFKNSNILGNMKVICKYKYINCYHVESDEIKLITYKESLKFIIDSGSDNLLKC